MCVKFYNNYREGICLTYSKKLEYLKSAVRSRSFENVRNKNGCVMSSTGRVDLSVSAGFNDAI